MPWKGPEFEGDFPTLGYQIADWIEANVVIPDGYLRGTPYYLTDEMLEFLRHFYRLNPEVELNPHSERPPDALTYVGSPLQKDLSPISGSVGAENLHKSMRPEDALNEG